MKKKLFKTLGIILAVLILAYAVLGLLSRGQSFALSNPMRTVDMKHLIDIGVDGIMTDYPHRLQEVYDSYGK